MIQAGDTMAAKKISEEPSPDADGKLADDFEIAIDRGQGLMRILHRNNSGVLSYQVLPADEAYALAQKILKGYDQLEGIK